MSGREALIAALRAMDPDEPETGRSSMLSEIGELQKTTREMVAQNEREERARAEDERIERLIGERLAKIEENTRPRDPEFKPRSQMTAKEKSQAMAKLGHDAYLALPK
jgi:hypothetical protein